MIVVTYFWQELAYFWFFSQASHVTSHRILHKNDCSAVKSRGSLSGCKKNLIFLIAKKEKRKLITWVEVVQTVRIFFTFFCLCGNNGKWWQQHMAQITRQNKKFTQHSDSILLTSLKNYLIPRAKCCIGKWLPLLKIIVQWHSIGRGECTLYRNKQLTDWLERLKVRGHEGPLGKDLFFYWQSDIIGNTGSCHLCLWVLRYWIRHFWDGRRAVLESLWLRWRTLLLWWVSMPRLSWMCFLLVAPVLGWWLGDITRTAKGLSLVALWLFLESWRLLKSLFRPWILQKSPR